MRRNDKTDGSLTEGVNSRLSLRDIWGLQAGVGGDKGYFRVFTQAQAAPNTGLGDQGSVSAMVCEGWPSAKNLD